MAAGEKPCLQLSEDFLQRNSLFLQPKAKFKKRKQLEDLAKLISELFAIKRTHTANEQSIETFRQPWQKRK